MRHLASVFVCVLVVLLPVTVAAEENCVLSAASGECVDRNVYAEAEIIPQGDVSTVKLYILNDGQGARSLFTGRSGETIKGKLKAFYDLDHVDGDIGAGKLAVPSLAFGNLLITAPRPLGYGSTLRNMAASYVSVAPGEKVHYCSFTVPARHVSGRFQYGVISFAHDKSTIIIDVRKVKYSQAISGNKE